MCERDERWDVLVLREERGRDGVGFNSKMGLRPLTRPS